MLILECGLNDSDIERWGELTLPPGRPKGTLRGGHPATGSPTATVSRLLPSCNPDARRALVDFNSENKHQSIVVMKGKSRNCSMMTKKPSIGTVTAKMSKFIVITEDCN